VVQIRLSADLHYSPIGKLAPQRAAQAFAIFQACASAIRIAIGRVREIDQCQDAGAAAETFDLEVQPPALLGRDSVQPPHQVAGFAPAFESHGVTPLFKHKTTGSQGKRILAAFHDDWILAGLEKSLDGQVRLARIGARGLKAGTLQTILL
jgi:hypothetical protein